MFDGSNDESYLSDQDEETQTTCSAAGHLVIVVLTMPEKKILKKLILTLNLETVPSQLLLQLSPVSQCSIY
jgi:hypothetical protein